MHTSPTSHNTPAVRTRAPELLKGMPDDILTHIVATHISVREGRALTSLACLSHAFAEWMKPHMKPVQLYRELENATEIAQASALHRCMGALYALAEINPAHRLELFRRVSTTLHHHFPGMAIEPHVDTLLASTDHLARVEQPAALLSLTDINYLYPSCTTKPRFLNMVGRIGALMPGVAQSGLATNLADCMFNLRGEEFLDGVQAFLRMSLQLPLVARVAATNSLLESLRRYGTHRPDYYGHPADDQQRQRNRQVLLWGLHDCLQSIRMEELPVEERMRLLGNAVVMPQCLPSAEEADKMAISLMRIIPEGDSDSYLLRYGEHQFTFNDDMEDMLARVFERPPGQSMDRFQRLYQAMAHLPPLRQIGWMREIMPHCAKRAERGVAPALIVATAEAALKLNQAQPALNLPIKLLYDLFALCLNPATLRKVDHYPFVEPAAVDPSEQPAYKARFDGNCGELMHLIRNVAPDIAGELILGINDALRKERPLGNILPGPDLFRTELYGCFLKQALAFLRSLLPANSAACVLQLKLPDLYCTDTRHADDWASSLMMTLAEISRDNNLVSVEQQETALADLLRNGIDVRHHSPARNKRLLAGLAAFPDAVCAHVLVRLLKYRHLAFAHYDVLFASMIEVARRLPDALRSSVLEGAAGGLTRLPDPKWRGITRSTLQQERDDSIEHEYPGLQNSDPDLYALLRPGYVSRMDGWALLLDAVETLPAQHQADRLSQLCGDTISFRFSNNRLSAQEKTQCSMRLISAVIGLPNGLRDKAFSSWLRYIDDQSYGPEERATIQAALLRLLLVLPGNEGKPLFEAYLATVWSEPAKAALQQRAMAHWKDAV